jgi:hypothetical protein
MMDMETSKQYLSNLYENFLLENKQYLPLAYRAKCLGAMEAILVILGVLTPGVPHIYQTVPFKFKLFWLIPITLPSKEGYQEYILRLAAQTLGK